MIRTKLENELIKLTNKSIDINNKLNELEKKRKRKLDLINIRYDLPKKIKSTMLIGMYTAVLGGLCIANIITPPVSIFNVISAIMTALCTGGGIFLSIKNIIDINKKIKIFHNYGYKLKDVKKNISDEKVGIKQSKISKDLNEEIFRPIRDLQTAHKEITDKQKIIWDILQSEDLAEKLNQYDSTYKKRRFDWAKENMPLIEDTLKSEFDEYLEYLKSINTEDIHFSNEIDEHECNEAIKRINIKKKVLTHKSHNLAIYK